MRSLLILAGCLAAAGCAEETVAQKEKDRLRGTWSNQETLPNKKVLKTLVIFSDGQVVFTGEVDGKGGTRTTCTYQLDPGKEPKEIDITETEASGKTVIRRGIYLLEGDSLTLLMGLRDRPKDIKSLQNAIRYVLERDKP